MSTTGDVNITLADGSAGAVVVPASQVQVVLGCSSSGTPAQIVATRSLSTLTSSFGYGPLCEAAGLVIQAGGTVLAMKVAQNAAGYVRGSTAAPLSVSGATNASPIVVTTSAAHGLTTGDVVTIASVGGNTAANGTWPVTVLTSTTFSIGVAGSGAYTSGGTVQPTGVRFTGTGTSVPTLTLDGTVGAYDDLYPQITCTSGGTRGTTGIAFQVSIDANRNKGPIIQLGTATSFTIPNTGITWNLGAGTLVAGDVLTFSTIAPAWTAAGVQSCLNALLASPYVSQGAMIGHIVGAVTGAVAATVQGYLDTLGAGYLFLRCKLEVRDASPPAKWSGAGETDATWAAAIIADFASASCKREEVGAGYYNMPTAFPSGLGGGYAGTPVLRRPLTWAEAARQVQVPQQRHTGRVRDGALAAIIVDPTNDPNDGFIYHDERLNPGFDLLQGGAGRFLSARTRIGYPGIYVVNPLLLSPLGSDFTLFPLGAVMDVACSIVHQTGQLYVNDDLRTNANGTIYEADARDIEIKIGDALRDNMTSVGMISGATVSVSRTTNLRTTSTVTISVTINARGYVLQENVTLAFANANAAA